MIPSLLFLYFFTLHADQLGFTVGGVNIRFNNVLALFLLLLFSIRYRKNLWEIDKKWFLALGMIFISLFLSTLFSPYKGRCAVFVGWYGFTFLCYALFPYLLVKFWDAERVFSLYFISFIAVGLYALGQLVISLLGFNDPFAQQRIIGEYVRPNAFAYEPSFYALSMSPFLVLCNFHYIVAKEKPFFSFPSLNLGKILFLNLLFLVSFTTTVIFTYAVFLSLLLLLPQFKAYRKRTLQFGLLIAGCLVLIGVCFPHLLKVYILKFVFQGLHSQASFYERWGGIANAWRVFKTSPLLGVGLGGYSPLLAESWLKGETTFTYFFHSLEGTKSLLKAFEPANVLTEVLASLGVVGLAAFAYLLVVLFKQIRRSLVNVKGEQMMLILNFALSLVVMLIVLQINQGLLRTYVWVHLSLVFGYVSKTNCGSKPFQQQLLPQYSHR